MVPRSLPGVGLFGLLRLFRALEESSACFELVVGGGSVAEGGWGEGSVGASGGEGPGDPVGVGLCFRLCLRRGGPLDGDCGVVFEVVAALAVAVGVGRVGGPAGCVLEAVVDVADRGVAERVAAAAVADLDQVAAGAAGEPGGVWGGGGRRRGRTGGVWRRRRRRLR